MEESRIIVEKKPQTEISIKAYFDNQKQFLLTIWLILWSAGGIGIITQFFTPLSSDLKIYLVVWLGFWAYFEYKVIYAFRWRKYGIEKLQFEEEVLLIMREIAGRAIPARYDKNKIKNVRIFKPDNVSVFTALSQSYWSPGDPKVVFEYQGIEIYFGLELKDDEAKKLADLVKKELKEPKL